MTNNIKKTIIESRLQTKEWREKQSWFKDGKRNECEDFQKNIVVSLTNKEILHSNERLHITESSICTKYDKYDCFEWTENFDGKQYHNDYTFYYNFKMICSNGGFQKRTLKDVYIFINSQLRYLKSLEMSSRKVFFVNILEGQFCDYYMECFKRLMGNKKYRSIFKYIFIGDIYSFESWFNKLKLNGIIQ